MESLLKMFLSVLIPMVDQLVTVEMLKKYGDKLFDFIEDAVADSETKIDDVVVLPFIKMFREKFNIPDND